MIQGLQLKTVPFSTPLFKNAFKAYPFTSPNSTKYLVLPNKPSELRFKSQFVCEVIENQNDNYSFILLEGQCLQEIINKNGKNSDDFVFTEEQIWILSICVSKAFFNLKDNKLQSKLTHFKQYCVRYLPEKAQFKIIFHESMISQLEAAKTTKKWDELYLSPEELNNNFIPQKSIVFSFGVLLLNLIAYSDRNRKIYHKNKYQVDPEIIKQKINIARQQYKYSKLLCNFVEQCLTLDDQERPNFTQLIQFLHRKFDKQLKKHSDLLSQIAEIEKNKGKSKGLSYQLPNGVSHQANQKGSNQKGENKKQQKQQNVIQQKAKEIPIKIQIQLQPQQKKPISKKKSSGKFEQLSKAVKQDAAPQQNVTLLNVDQMRHNIQYRGTFGSRYVSHNQNSSDTPASTSSKKARNLSSDQQSEDEHKISTFQKQSNQISTGTKQYSPSSFNISRKLSQHFDSSLKTSKSKFQIVCHNGTHQFRQHECHVDSQNDQDSIETPRGFGYSHHDEAKQDSIKKNIQKLSEKYQMSASSRQIPELMKKMQNLSIQLCLRPLQQLISIIGKIGVWVEGDLYYGDFENGRRNGLALQIFSNGQYYFGYFKQDLFSGEGLYFWNDREYYFGMFELGQKVWGRLEGQIQYQGGFKYNKRHGEGTCWYCPSEIYSGEWVNGKRHGKGKLFEKQGSVFIGTWVKGKIKGEGCLQIDGMKIVGNWNNQNIEGEALVEYGNGDLFKGKIGLQLQKIQGEYISRSGKTFIGIFQDDEPRKGTYKFTNGDVYVGELLHLKRHGYGQYYYSSGEVYKGMWENNARKQ